MLIMQILVTGNMKIYYERTRFDTSIDTHILLFFQLKIVKQLPHWAFLFVQMVLHLCSPSVNMYTAP